ncbi:MAG: hypothetical protein JRF41_05060 [Deltaproteobacteria bacterium]|nr:hypothetical protein [Deltaproteobacteria bacterium]MBW2050882.1 hypothetical protein [Deltaproteobacteria bacterium]MBW2322881.1 hypothetical protein [Deltaproteobacteria bacterium]
MKASRTSRCTIRPASLENVETLVLNYVAGNFEAEAVWRRFGFKSAIMTAAAKLEELE